MINVCQINPSTGQLLLNTNGGSAFSTTITILARNSSGTASNTLVVTVV